MKRKRKRIISILLVMSLILHGCAAYSDYLTPEEVAAQQMETIIQAIMDKNVEAIEELFCPYVRERDQELAEEIEGIFDFVEGDIISYDPPDGDVGGRSWNEDGYTELHVSALAKNVCTSSGKVYIIGHGADTINKEKPEYVGVQDIAVYEDGRYDPKSGWEEGAVYRVILEEMLELPEEIN